VNEVNLIWWAARLDVAGKRKPTFGRVFDARTVATVSIMTCILSHDPRSSPCSQLCRKNHLALSIYDSGNGTELAQAV
jgi:hypothetical protein